MNLGVEVEIVDALDEIKSDHVNELRALVASQLNRILQITIVVLNLWELILQIFALDGKGSLKALLVGEVSVVGDLPDIVFSEFPYRATDLFSIVEESGSPVSSLIADVGAEVDFVLLDKELGLPVCVLDLPLVFIGLAVRGLHRNTIVS